MDTAPKTDKAPEKIHWHPAFYQAIKAELLDWKEVLQFEYEYQLTSEPLRVDTLIILKPPGIRIPHSIGRIFKTVNIVEYKSPEDSFTEKDFYKVYAYGALYAAIHRDVGMSDLTLTFVVSRHPRELLKYLRVVRGYEVVEVESGIYEVRGDYIPMQIIACPKLSGENSRLMGGLKKNLKREEAASILEEGKRRGKETALDAYFDAIFHANPRPFQEVVQMGDGSITFEEVLMEEGFIPKWLALGEEKGIEKGREEVAQNLLKKGWSIEETAETTELDIEKVRLLAQNIR
ncbi:hypothetical protein LQZ21_14435 [Treponema sp. TIM-1]|uniref:hypothetical protein n=1 Tax=Treponema sp. TIM-1 TaxID=2898417 RepID=UPI00397EAF5F